MADNYTASNVTSERHLQTELYAVVWSALLLILVLILGVLPNLVILVAARCREKMHSWRYALVYSACVINILFCVTWIPVNFGVVMTTYRQQTLHASVCYAHATLLHFCVGSLSCTAIFLGIQRLSAVWSHSDRRYTSTVFLAGGVVLSWLVGLLCSLYVGVYHSTTYSYAVCTGTRAAVVAGDDDQTHGAEAVLCVIYSAALLSTLLVFILLSLCRRQSINSHCKKLSSCQYRGIPHRSAGADDDDKIRSTMSQTSPTKSSLRDNSETKKSSGTLAGGGSKKVCLQEPTADDIHDISDADEDDDDQFDMKMRLKLAKKGSGRRHTVANIGLSEGGARGRRGSMEDPRVSAHPANYQYVRKWSVDIVALQNQLENPKINPLPFKELVEFRAKKQKEDVADTNDTAADNKKAADTEENGTKVKDLKVIKEQISEEGADGGEPVSTSSLEVPAITVQYSNHSNTADGDEVIVQTYADTADTDTDDSEYRSRLRCHLVSLWRSTLLLLVLLLGVLPLCVYLTVAGRPALSVKYVLSGLLVVPCPLIPAVVVWADSVVRDSVRKLYRKAATLRCVCYCNIGKRRRCFGRPEYS